MKPIPKATQQQKKDGWTFDYAFLDKISKRTRETGFYAGMEETEAVLKQLLDIGYVEIEA